MQGILPLKAGALLARVLERRAGVRVTLKWPNDLLFAGRKLGGVLLEGSTKANESGEVLVGIGLNLAVAPEIAGPYRSIALSDVIGDAPAPQTVATWIAEAFHEEWQTTAARDVPRLFQDYAIDLGSLWRDAQGGLTARVETPNADGTLPLAPLVAVHREREGVSCEFLRGRLVFRRDGKPDPAPFPSLLIIFRPAARARQMREGA